MALVYLVAYVSRNISGPEGVFFPIALVESLIQFSRHLLNIYCLQTLQRKESARLGTSRFVYSLRKMKHEQHMVQLSDKADPHWGLSQVRTVLWIPEEGVDGLYRRIWVDSRAGDSKPGLLGRMDRG